MTAYVNEYADYWGDMCHCYSDTFRYASRVNPPIRVLKITSDGVNPPTIEVVHIYNQKQP
jgi:hypothetical protein